jgi:hypothetical protein
MAKTGTTRRKTVKSRQNYEHLRQYRFIPAATAFRSLTTIFNFGTIGEGYGISL